eukprot:1601900-Pleurochrysis_carterae.AAC.1
MFRSARAPYLQPRVARPPTTSACARLLRAWPAPRPIAATTPPSRTARSTSGRRPRRAATTRSACLER